jgi:hypothetical protein
MLQSVQFPCRFPILFQTCRYKGVSFYKFLLSREQDIDAFRRGHRTHRQSPAIEVYPPGFVSLSLAAWRNPKPKGGADSSPERN